MLPFPRPAEEAVKPVKAVEDMNVDEFLSGDFLGGEDAEAGVSSGSDSDSEDEAALLAAGSDEDEDVEAGSDEDEEVGSDEDEDVEAGSDEGDSDEDAGAGPQVAASTNKLQSAVAKHKAELEALKQKDPEFYQYLQVCGVGVGGRRGASEWLEEGRERRAGLTADVPERACAHGRPRGPSWGPSDRARRTGVG